MSKPEDIPQDVWDKTYEWAAAFNADPFMTVGDVVARAIMAAKAEERRECEYAARTIDPDRSKDLGWFAGFEAARSQAATAIRKRGEA